MGSFAIELQGWDKIVQKHGQAAAKAALRKALDRTTVYTAELVVKRLGGEHVVTGFLRASITGQAESDTKGRVFAKQGSGVYYAKFVESGTGLYGPKKQVIRPKHAKVMAWHPRSATGRPLKGKALKATGATMKKKGTVGPIRGEGMIARRTVKGQRPVQMFHNTYVQDQGKITARFQSEFKKAFQIP
jgi:hypothetical protein